MSKTTEKSKGIQRGQLPLRQGQIIAVDPSIVSWGPQGAPVLQKGTLLIVISHDCDIASSVDKEPLVEVIPVEMVEKLDSRKTHARNARSLHLKAKDGDGTAHWIALEASRKAIVEKTHLDGHSFEFPLLLDQDDLAVLIDWLSARYRRAALPNCFEERYSRVKEAFWKLVGDFNHTISAVLFLFDEGQEKRDCGRDEPYCLSIMLVHPERELDLSDNPLVDNIYDLFERRYASSADQPDAGIELRNCSFVSEHALPLAVYKAAIHHRIEWISYESYPQGPTI